MGSVRAVQGERDPSQEAEKRRPSGLGTVTVVFLLALPLLLLFFLFGDRAVASIAADYPVWQRFKVQSSGNASSSRRAERCAHDRLLGGLLSPDFDAATCLSRYEASRRWKPSPFPVSPYLVRKLRQYEANHRRCGPGTANYRDAMAQLMSGRNADRAECKYVVWLPLQGLGNRMLSVVSTFLYALLAGRVLLVHEPPEMEGLFCEPFPGTSWVLPPEFPYTDGFSADSKESYVNMLENNIVRYDGSGDAGALPAYVYFHLEQISLRLQNHTFCEEDHRVLGRFNWMVLRSDSYFAVALFLMPVYRGELDRMFPAKASVFHHLGRYLLHPGNRAWGIVVTVFQPSHDQDQHTEALAHNERALAEIFLLSYSDRLVTTGFSTFGYAAHSLAGLRPWLLLLPDRATMRAEVACVRSASVEPCLHSPPSLVCRAEQDLDPVAHVPFLRPCEDVYFGLKLI
ncbi:galactoside 2-alpha-L-fucosyltransferase-like isoform X2 [Panicum hallii]|uniref:galactoside 2-alpha-L-fucosyltransferase-like isoform X2 n=1 Tax=Panicum hallii TaxID=206008 RepID=UPI000DF4E8AE|nr:galactoside 2-alpha-L-fucosyltransferase-like isoform X2 [Panicum hallii]